MIYGLNFNSTEIPRSISRLFSNRLNVSKLEPTIIGKHWSDEGMRQRHKSAILAGVATTKNDCALMVLQATNGNRSIFVHERKTPTGQPIYGVYVW